VGGLTVTNEYEFGSHSTRYSRFILTQFLIWVLLKDILKDRVSMLELWLDKENKWVGFYPMKNFDQEDTRSLAEMEDEVYGKYIGGLCGYQPWWVHLTVKKSKLRAIQ
jgi:hypothetical protein